MDHGSHSAYWTDLGGGQPPSLIGHPIYQSSAMDGTITSGSDDDVSILGDFRQGYCIVDRVGTTLAYNPVVLGVEPTPDG